MLLKIGRGLSSESASGAAEDGSGLLLADNASFLLLADGASKLLLAS